MVGEGGKVEPLEAHFGEQAEGDVGLAGDSVTHDERVVEADAVVAVGVAGEGMEPIEHDGHEVGAGEDLENGMVGDGGVVEVALAAGPIEEPEAGEDVGTGAEVGEDLEDERLVEAEVEAGEGGVDGGIFVGGEEYLVDEIEDGWVAGAEPLLEGGGDGI